jgi:acyl-CoA reductase-like NAD-dependent aldehyde dehydrogenase
VNYINGSWLEGHAEAVTIASPFDGRALMQIRYADLEQVKFALTAAAAADLKFKNSSRYLRSRLLEAMSRLAEARRDELIDSIVDQAGKPRILAKAEVDRAVRCLKLAAEEACRLGGECLPMDVDPIGQGFHAAHLEYFSRGPVLAITPFNFPLNLVIHKVAPALAVGAPVFLKPAPQTPGPANILAEIFHSARCSDSELEKAIPASALQVVHTHHQNLDFVLTDKRIASLSFTGSDQVGWQLQSKAIGKKLTLELGGDAAVIICRDADLEKAAKRCAFGAFAFAGQICISVQRILIATEVFEKFIQLLRREAELLVCGEPNQPNCLVGPLVNNAAVQRITNWLSEATSSGAKVLTGGNFEGRVMRPTIITDLPGQTALACNEAFAPIVTVESFDQIQQAIDRVNSSRFGLQAGVFTDSSTSIDLLFRDLQVGGLIVNEIPTYRADHIPYGGIKDSGLGREGIRYAMLEYSEPKTLVRARS